MSGLAMFGQIATAAEDIRDYDTVPAAANGTKWRTSPERD